MGGGSDRLELEEPALLEAQELRAALSGEGVRVPISGDGEPEEPSNDGGAECAPGEDAAGKKSSERY